MNLLSKLAHRLGYVPKSAAVGLARRYFNAAAINRLTADWSTGAQSLDSALRYELEPMRTRSRELARNNPYAVKFIAMLKANVLGSGGLMLKNKAADPWQFKGGKIVAGRPDVYANKVIEDKWWDWGRRENCTTNRRLCWEEVQALALETIGTDGEMVMRTYPGWQNKYRFAVSLIPTDLLDHKKNEELANGNVIRMGVEVDPQNTPIAYHFLTSHPGDYGFPTRSTINRHERVPAEHIVDPFIMREIGQTRGFPWLAPTMLNLKMLGGYEEAELVAARTAASKMAFLKSTGEKEYQGRSDPRQMEAQPGMIEQLPDGLELQVLDWNHPSANYGTFVKAALRGMAAGLNVSYNTLANDLEGVNFSSGRMGQMEEREHWKFLQAWFAESFCTPVFSRWLFLQLNLGLVPLPNKYEKFNAPTWVGRRWSWVDPTKEVSARIQELNSGLTSLTRVLAEANVDRDELLDEIADDQAALADRKISLPELWQEEQKPEAPAPDDDEDSTEEPPTKGKQADEAP